MAGVRKSTKSEENCELGKKDKKGVVNVLWHLFH